jgi:hypothetical protein
LVCATNGAGQLTNLVWRFVEALALELSPSEREAVLGDLIETRTPPWRALREISGLVTLRQLQLWNNWRPWVAAFGLALPASFILMGTSVSISSTFQRMRGQTVTANDTLLNLVFIVFLMISWSWTAGFVVSSISRRTLWISGLSSLIPCLFCFARFRIESLPRFSLFLFILPAVLGAWQGTRTMRVNLGFAVVVAASLTTLMILTWSNGFWLFKWALLWPSWYIVATASGNATMRRRV